MVVRRWPDGPPPFQRKPGRCVPKLKLTPELTRPPLVVRRVEALAALEGVSVAGAITRPGCADCDWYSLTSAVLLALLVVSVPVPSAIVPPVPDRRRPPSG